MKRSRGRVQGGKVVSQGGGGAAQPQLQPPDLNRPALDLSRATYLSTAEAVQYLRFVSVEAFYDWVRRYSIPKCTPSGGRRLLFLRRDLDEAVQQRRQGSHAGAHR